MGMNIDLLKYTFLTLLGCVNFSTLYAIDNLDEIRERYANEMAVFLNYKESVVIDIVDDSLSIVSETYQEILHLNEQSKMLANGKVYSSHFIGISQLEASTFIPYKNKYKEYKVQDFKESFDKNSSVFFDDNYNYTFTYPAIQNDAKTILKYKEIYRDPHILNKFLFKTYLPIVHAEFTIKVNKNVDMRFHIFNDDLQVINRKQTEQGDFIMYSFSAEYIDKQIYESNSFGMNYYIPHIVCAINYYKDENGTTHNVLSSMDDLYSWYMSFIDSIKPQETNVISEVLSGIINDNMTELEKVKAIYYWVQSNIKYIAFEDGMRGFIPHNGNYVCEKRYGDCKDMSSILVAMLHEAGIKAYYTWIGTRDLPYKYDELYSPIVDNHMIATYIQNDQIYYLDATSQYTSFGLPSSMIQGKQALIAINKNKYLIEEVPVIEADQSKFIDSCHFTFQKNSLIGTGSLILSGFQKTFNSYKLVGINQKSVEKKVENLLGKGHNKFFIEEFKIEQG